MNTHKQNSGFMALMSAIIISAILLLIITNLGLTSFYGRSNILDFELKEKSFVLAEACGDTAMLKLATNYDGYAPTNESVSVDGDICTIESVTGTPKLIKVKADYEDYITHLEIEVDNDINITSFREV